MKHKQNEITLVPSQLSVSAVLLRDVWKALEIRQKYADWIKRQLEHFEEGSDYCPLHIDVKRVVKGGAAVAGHNIKDHVVSLDTAKHIALMSHTEKGKEYRALLISLEKQVQAHQLERAKTRLSFPSMTDSLKESREMVGKKTASIHYCNEAKMINKIIGLPGKVDRDTLVPATLKKLDALTKMNTILIDSGQEYKSRKSQLKVFYTNMITLKKLQQK